jgi:hypothetical protein
MNVAPGSWVDASVDVADLENDHLNYSYFITDVSNDPLIVQPPRFYPTEQENQGPGKARVRVPNDPGSYRLYTLVDDGHGDVAIADESLTVKRKEQN